MKKSLFAVLLSLSTWAHADVLCPFLFNVVVQNNTGEQCRLVYQNVRMGNSRSKGIQDVIIENGQQSRPFTFETEVGLINEAVDVDLSFACGDKMATFSSKKAVVKYVVYNSPTFTGNTSSLANMDAEYTVKPQSCFSLTQPARPDTMIWTLH